MEKAAQLKKILIVSLPCLLLMMLWVFIQTRIGIHADNVYFIQAAQRLLAGGSYLHGFFEPNPPLVILLNIPVIFLAKYTAFNSTDAFRFYVAILGLLSVGLSYNLLSRIIADTKSLVVMLSAITLVMFILPNVAFGERESLFFILSLPYVWMVLLRIEKIPVATVEALIVGVMAGIGFCLKPYFFMLPLALEAWLIIQHKYSFAWLRIESICIALVALCYLASVFLFFPDYVHAVVPILTKYYLITTWQTMLFDPVCAYIVTVLISAVILYKRLPYPHITKLLMLTIVALAAAYYFSRRPDYYHQLPMLSMTIILGCWCGWQIAGDLFSRSRSPALLTPELFKWFLAAIVLFFIVPTTSINSSSINLMTLRLVIAMLSLLSIAIIYQYSQRIFADELLRFLMRMVFMVSLFFSAIPYGQREQLMVVLVMPYLFDRMLMLQDQKNRLGLITGVMFGCALIIDYHLALLAILEIFVLFQNKKIMRKSYNALLIACVIYALYLLGSFNFLLQELGFNVSVIKKYYLYSLTVKHPANEGQFENMNRYYCYLVAVMSAIHFKKTNYRIVNGILLLSLLVFIGLSFWWQPVSHFATIPALCTANLLVALIIGELLLTKPSLMRMVAPCVFIEKLLICILACAVLFLGAFSTMYVKIQEFVEDTHNKKASSLTAFFAQHPNSTFDYFAEDNDKLLVSIYSKAHFVGQFPMFWWLERMKKQLSDQNHSDEQALALKDESLLVGMIAQSLIANKPQYIIVTTRLNTSCVISSASPLGPYHCQTIADTNGSYIKLFSKYQTFREAWQSYKYVDTFDDVEVYQRG